MSTAAASAANQDHRRQPSKAARRRVREAFDPKVLAATCVSTDFSAYAEKYDLEPGRDGHDRFFYFADRGADVLAVAHLDSVQADGRCAVMHTTAGWMAASGALDDRLGAYVILDLLPKLGVNVDVLLTTDEEICHSTATAFRTEKSYNWMFSFDRGGTDVVMYQYESPELVALVEDSGARVGTGSYSDIADLDILGCAGFNWGVGYQDYHGSRSHAWLEDTFRMVARFVKFHQANADVRLRFDADDDAWWSDMADMVVADCGHEVDLNDSMTYCDEGGTVVCDDCGSLDRAWERASASALERLTT